MREQVDGMPEIRSFGRDERAVVLERQRTQKMARSAHAYVRGNTLEFYEWLDGPARGTLPEGPPIWICGDCHLGNLGPLADADGRVDIQIRDLDQTVVGNPAHDLIRLGLSLASAARGSDLPGRRHRPDAGGDGPRLRAGPGGARSDEAPPEPDAVRTVRRRALGRQWKHLARERLKDVEPSIPLGRKFWALDDAERAALDDLFGQEAVRRLVLALNGRDDGSRRPPGRRRLLDEGLQLPGLPALRRPGADRRAERPAQLALVDLKEAVEAAAPAAPGRRRCRRTRPSGSWPARGRSRRTSASACCRCASSASPW